MFLTVTAVIPEAFAITYCDFFSLFAKQERYSDVAASPSGFFPADISSSSTTDMILTASLLVLSLIPTAFAILVINSDGLNGSNLRSSTLSNRLYFLDRSLLLTLAAFV